MTDRIRLYRVAVAFCVVLGCASRATAFDFLIHVDITKMSLSQVVDKFVADLKQPTAREDLAKRRELDPRPSRRRRSRKSPTPTRRRTPTTARKKTN
jgi:hypothetical protein